MPGAPHGAVTQADTSMSERSRKVFSVWPAGERSGTPFIHATHVPIIFTEK